MGSFLTNKHFESRMEDIVSVGIDFELVRIVTKERMEYHHHHHHNHHYHRHQGEEGHSQYAAGMQPELDILATLGLGYVAILLHWLRWVRWLHWPHIWTHFEPP